MNGRKRNLVGKAVVVGLAALGGYVLAILYGAVAGSNGGVAAMDREFKQIVLWSMTCSIIGAGIVMLIPIVMWEGYRPSKIPDAAETETRVPIATNDDLNRELKLRLVRGEISVEEYGRLRTALDA